MLARLDLAFSRDQPEKIHVQTRMRENAAELRAWLEQGAHFYVCGDAKRMAKDVETALMDIAMGRGGKSATAAKAGWTASPRQGDTSAMSTEGFPSPVDPSDLILRV